MKKTFAVISLLSVLGLTFALPVLGASQLISWDATNTTELGAWITQVWSDLYVPILLGLGVAMGFIILRKTIGLVKGSAR